jgi:probable addiction module antidote protein
MPKTSSYDAWLLKNLTDPKKAASYLNAAIEDSPEMFLTAFLNVVKAAGLKQVADEAGVAREAVYGMLSEKGNPTFESLTGLLSAVGIQMQFVPKEAQSAPVGEALKQVTASQAIQHDVEVPGLVEQLRSRFSQVVRKPESLLAYLK